MVESNFDLDLLAQASVQSRGTMSKAKKREDTGVFWDEPLDLYLKGTINVNFYNNIGGYYAGDTISGTIDVEIGEYFEAQDLVIEFKGVERSHMGVS